ncbi:MAG TPA: leishmanolysin-related zinc metalloendopeptidase [Pseudonocardia sp.]|nr:leishmanolysin-related zinc metalloendopeptidase [Pseudonocardia sp.]
MSAPDRYAGDRYVAVADGRRASTQSPFRIEVRFVGGLSPRQRDAFAAAADRWTRVIVGDLPDVEVDGETVDDVLILAQGAAIDGSGQVLGQAGPTHLRPAGAGPAALLPAKGAMSFDSADLEALEAEGTLDDVITHEMGHVLGIGTLWARKGLLAGSGTDDPTFRGGGAVAEYGALTGAQETGVPVENTGGPGTREGHWRESVFGNELMSGFIRVAGNPLSRMTVASLADLDYQVDLEAAEEYALPAPAPAGEAPALTAPGGTVLPVVPFELPASSLLG